MTEPSQYFKGRTVQEQMNEVIGYVDTRAAEVATTAIASDVAQVHQDMLDADADASAAAASAAAAAGTLANAVKKTGEASQSIAGDIDVSGDLSASGTTRLVDVAVSTTIEVPTPASNADAANKKYVDDADALKINITDINSYAVGLTGNQVKAGTFGLNPNAQIPFVIQRPTDDLTQTPASNQYSTIVMSDANNVQGLAITRGHYTNGQTQFIIALRGQSGNYANLILTLNSNDTGALTIKKPDGTSVTLASW